MTDAWIDQSTQIYERALAVIAHSAYVNRCTLFIWGRAIQF
ncbi:MAG: hypothetical protein V3S14_00905 [Anaerolineae bacterium]